jgi:hypothetical protein
LLFLLFHISPQVEVAWNEVRRSRGQDKGPACLIQASKKFSFKKVSHAPLRIIGVAPVADMSQSKLPNITQWVSSLFSSCFILVCATFSRIH